MDIRSCGTEGVAIAFEATSDRTNALINLAPGKASGRRLVRVDGYSPRHYRPNTVTLLAPGASH